MAKKYIIYETKNLKDGKTYIGMHETNDIEDCYLGSGKRLKRAIRYYGKEFFERKILHYFNNREDMIAKEIELVDEAFVNRKDTYNLMLGGKGGKNSEESKEKNRQKHLGDKNPMYGKPKTDKQIKAASNTLKKLHAEGRVKHANFKDKHHTIKTKQIIGEKNSIKQSGRLNSQYGTKWIHSNIIKKNRKIKKNEEIPNNWELGRKMKFD